MKRASRGDAAWVVALTRAPPLRRLIGHQPGLQLKLAASLMSPLPL